MRIVSTDVSSTTGENQTRVILSTCESSSTCRESTDAVDAPDVAPSSRRKCSCPSRPFTTSRCAPFRRRVSFSEASVIGTDDRHATIMQNDDDSTSSRRDREGDNDNGERETYDIWQTDDSSAGRSDDGYSESAPRIDNYAENYCVSDCTSNNNKSQRTHSDNTDELAVESNGRMRGEWVGKNDVCRVNHIDNKTRKVDEEDIISNEDLSNFIHKDIDSTGRDEYRMRGGCNGCCCGVRENVRRSSQNHGCCCGGFVPKPNESNADAETACTVSSRCCCCPRICKKAVRCNAPPCTTDARSCGSGSCGSGCREGCGKPGQICTPSPRICNSPAHFLSRGRSPCSSRFPPQSPCSTSGCRSCCSGASYECGRSRSPKCRPTIGSCINDRAKCGTDGACCRLRLPCECLGGGLDCRRCDRKVYQAEMQIVSGVPYHNICFSCFCCRKPLEPLTYQENCGEIYCKQCYVRNFGPQGYGYGAGAGALQTPL